MRLADSWIRAFVRHFVRRKAWDASLEDQDDIVQESFKAVWCTVRREDLQLRSTFRSYVVGTAAHCCINWVRRRIKEKFLDELDPDVPLPDPAPNPEQRLEREEQCLEHEGEVRALMEAIGRLGPLCQEVIRLIKFEGVTSKEAAHRLGIRSDDTVRWRLADCVRRLRELVSPSSPTTVS